MKSARSRIFPNQSGARRDPRESILASLFAIKAIRLKIQTEAQRAKSDFATPEGSSYLLPSANPPKVSGTVTTSGPLVWPAMTGLPGTVS